jgi:hypothetical protein
MAAAAALMTTVGLGAFSGTAQADGLYFLKGWGTDQCLSTNHTTHIVTVDNCSRADRWFFQRTDHPDSDGYSMLQVVNFPDTSMCLRAAAVAVRGANRLAPCDPNDLSQVWDNTNHFDELNQLKLGVPGTDLCLDRPTEAHYDGESMQLWSCAEPHVPAFGDSHMEQRFDIVQ